MNGHGLARSVVLGGIAALLVATCTAEAARDDTGPAQRLRAHTVERLRAGDLSVEGPSYTVLSYEPLTVFFLSWTGFAPDPYCGYEYAEDQTSVETDPLKSGHGDIEDIGNGWYWLCAR